MLIPTPAREEWLKLRQKYIGGSEIACLFGVQAQYQMDHFALHMVKAGLAPPPEVNGKRIRAGLLMQDDIAELVMEDYGWQVTPGRYAIADDCPGMAASLDFEISSDPSGKYRGPGVLETKNVDWMVHRDSWTDEEPPIHILLQLQHQLGCTGWEWGAVAGWVGGNDLAVYPYPARPKVIANIKAKVAEFWERIAASQPPNTSGSESCAHVLRSLYPQLLDDVVDMSESNEWPEACADFLRAAEEKRAWTATYEAARNRLASLLENHQRAFGGGYRVSTVVTPQKMARPAAPGEIISGRKESRRYTVKDDSNG